jgi:hypothetical protein
VLQPTSLNSTRSEYNAYSKNRKGVYPLKSFPATLGQEAAGILVGLPTDENVLNSQAFKMRNFEKGGKVAVVRFDHFPSIL